jgi:alkylhydroperoxidase family enzyme
MSRIADTELPADTSEIMRNNLHRALAGNRAMADNFYLLANSIHRDSRVAQRLRELAILRTAARVGSDFEWSHHFAQSELSGISADEARALRDDDLRGFSEAERCVIALADAIDERATTGQIWDAARGFLSEAELLDLVMAASFYGYASRLTLALDVRVDPGMPTIAAS